MKKHYELELLALAWITLSVCLKISAGEANILVWVIYLRGAYLMLKSLIQAISDWKNEP